MIQLLCRSECARERIGLLSLFPSIFTHIQPFYLTYTAEKPSKKVRHDEAVEGNGENEQAVGPVEVVVDSVGVVLDSLETVDPVEAIESVEGIDPTELTHNKANTPESIVGEVSATIDDPLTEQSTTLTGESAKESTVMESPTPKKTAATKAAINSPATALPAGIPSLDTTTQPTVTNPDAMVEERTQVSSLYVGRVIGKGGEMIRDLQARSGCRIDVDQNVPAGQPRIITYRGTRRTVEDAKKMVLLLCQQDGSETLLPIGEAKRKHLTVPSSSIGKIIGRGGEMIRELQNRSQAKIQVDHSGNSQTGNTRAMTITGTNQAVVKAEEMVLFLVANPLMDAMISINMLMEDKIKNGGRWGSGPPYMNMANHGQNMMPPGQQQPQLNMHGGGTSASNFSQSGNSGFGGGFPGYPQPATHQGSVGHYGILPTQQSHFAGVSDVEVFFAAKMFMGRIIGQKGMTINDVQKISGCDIQVNQNVPHGQDCEITIKGSRQGIENVKQMLREIIEMGPNHPYAGGQGRKYHGLTLFALFFHSLYTFMF